MSIQRMAGDFWMLRAERRWLPSGTGWKRLPSRWRSRRHGLPTFTPRNSTLRLQRNSRDEFSRWHLRECASKGRVYFTSGGSEATETALKLARQYWLERGESKRFRVISRLQSYHGSTLGALSVSGNVRRREPFAPMLPEWGHIPPCYCYRCPYGLRYPECNVECAVELNRMLERDGSDDVAAFIFEPVVGATLGAVPPPDGYVQRIAEICRQHGILLIADEVMTGMGRTGKPFAVEHWGATPDMILVGKGIASGYAPLGAVIVAGTCCGNNFQRIGDLPSRLYL